MASKLLSSYICGDIPIVIDNDELLRLLEENRFFCGAIENGVVDVCRMGRVIDCGNNRAIEISYDIDESGFTKSVEANVYFVKDEKFLYDSENPLNGQKLETFEDIRSAINYVKNMDAISESDINAMIENQKEQIEASHPEFFRFINENALCIEEKLNGIRVIFENGSGIDISENKVIPFIEGEIPSHLVYGNNEYNNHIPAWGTYGSLHTLSDSELVHLSENLVNGELEKIGEYNREVCCYVGNTFFSMNVDHYLSFNKGLELFDDLNINFNATSFTHVSSYYVPINSFEMEDIKVNEHSYVSKDGNSLVVITSHTQESIEFTEDGDEIDRNISSVTRFEKDDDGKILKNEVILIEEDGDAWVDKKMETKTFDNPCDALEISDDFVSTVEEEYGLRLGDMETDGFNDRFNDGFDNGGFIFE